MPASRLFTEKANGADVASPSFNAPWKYSTFSRFPSGSDAVAVTVTPAGAVNVLPSSGLLIEITGARLLTTGGFTDTFTVASVNNPSASTARAVTV